MPHSDSDYKARAIRLRELGLLPKGYRSNSLTESQKRHIRRVENTVTGKAGKIPDYVSAVKVPTKHLATLKEKGIPVKRGKGKSIAIVQTWHAKKVGWDERSKSFRFDYGNRVHRIYPLDSDAATFIRITNFFERRQTKLNQRYMTLKIGNSNVFHRQFLREEEFHKYMSDVFKPKASNAWDFLSVVEVMSRSEFERLPRAMRDDDEEEFEE